MSDLKNSNQASSKEQPFLERIMVVDDTYIDRFIVERLVKKIGFSRKVISMESAMDALNYLRQHADQPTELPRIIFLDIRMPEMDGFGFLASYELLPDTVKENCTLIMLSSSLNPDDLQRVEDNRYVNRFISKPLDREKLENIIADYSGNPGDVHMITQVK